MDKSLTINQAAQQNLRVWARRLDIQVDLETAYRDLETHFPGSVLVGPLAVCFSIYFKDSIENRTHRRRCAWGVANVVAENARANKNGRIWEQLHRHVSPITLCMYSLKLVEAVDVAMLARYEELSRPSVGDEIARKILFKHLT